jgi:hypothetical protein
LLLLLLWLLVNVVCTVVFDDVVATNDDGIVMMGIVGTLWGYRARYIVMYCQLVAVDDGLCIAQYGMAVAV